MHRNVYGVGAMSSMLIDDELSSASLPGQSNLLGSTTRSTGLPLEEYLQKVRAATKRYPVSPIRQTSIIPIRSQTAHHGILFDHATLSTPQRRPSVPQRLDVPGRCVAIEVAVRQDTTTSAVTHTNTTFVCHAS
ncbi:unnamed protein product [Sphagnum balticum]